MNPFLRMMAMGLAVGAIGFALGFFGPILLTPEANQGPLLGIFITGPFGFVLGLFIGAWRERKRGGASSAGLGHH